MEYKGYTARVIFDGEAGVLFGEVEGLRDVVTFEATNVKDLAIAFRDSVDDYLAMCAEREEEPEKPYSGKFLVRVDPRLHRDVSIAAARSGKSLNAFATEVLKAWIVREAKVDPVTRLPAALASSPIGHLEPYATGAPPVVIANSQAPSPVWEEVTRNTPGSITPARGSNTPPASRTPHSSKATSRRAA